MKLNYTLKKILPAILIVAILATGFFGTFAFGVDVANAQTDPRFLEEPQDIIGSEQPVIDEESQAVQPVESLPKTLQDGGESIPVSTDVTVYTEQELRTYLNKRYGISSKNLNELDKTQLDALFQQKLREDKFAEDEISAISTGNLPLPDKVVKKEEPITGCNILWNFNLAQCLTSISAWIGQGVLTIFSLFVGFAGWILDYAVVYTIVNMGDNVDKIGFIEEGWKAFRDVANIILIFVLLAIGIATILRIEQYGIKALLAKLIIVALLINFSLFFTQVIIDVSNIIALQFYEQITQSGSVGVGSSYMQAFQLATLYDSGGAFNPQALTSGLGFGEILLISALGSIVFLVATFTFLAGAFLLIARYVVLVFLMILAPLAFVGMVLPAVSEHAKKWWTYLFHYSFFAPIYLLLTWFVINVINSKAFKDSIGLKQSDMTFAKVGAGGAKVIEAMPILINFIIVIFFIIASLIIAHRLGIAGSNIVISWGQYTRKWGQGMVRRGAMAPVRRGMTAARTYAGKKSEEWQEKGRFKRVPFASRTMGALGAAGRSEAKKAEDKYSHLSTAALRNRVTMITTSKTDKAAIRSLLIEREKGDPRKASENFLQLDANKQKEIYLGMSARNQIALESHLEKAGGTNKQLDDLLGVKNIKGEREKGRLESYLSQEDKDKRKKSEKETQGKQDERDLKEADPNAVLGIVARISAANRLQYLPSEILTMDKVFKNMKASDFRQLTRNSKLKKEDKAFIKSEILADRLLPPAVHAFFTSGPSATLW